MSDPQPQSPPPPDPTQFYGHLPYASHVPYASERSGVFVFGVIAIVLGALSGCFTLFIPLALIAPQPAGAARPQLAQMITGALVYALAAVALVWGGMGMVQRRRWTRPLVLSFGGIVLVLCALGLIAFAFMMPSLLQAISAGSNQRALPTAFFVGFGIGFTFVLAIVFAVPALFVWYFRKPNVKAMLETSDPQTRWTDRCPIPALTLVVLQFLYGTSLLMSVPQQIAMGPGFYLFGLVAILWNAALAAIAFTLAWLTYNLRPVGWWGSLVLTILSAIFCAITIMRSDLAEVYKQAGYPQATVDTMKQLNIGTFKVIWVAPFLATAIFIAAIRKYFTGKPMAGSPEITTSESPVIR